MKRAIQRISVTSLHHTQSTRGADVTLHCSHDSLEFWATRCCHLALDVWPIAICSPKLYPSQLTFIVQVLSLRKIMLNNVWPSRKFSFEGCLVTEPQAFGPLLHVRPPIKSFSKDNVKSVQDMERWHSTSCTRTCSNNDRCMCLPVLLCSTCSSWLVPLLSKNSERTRITRIAFLLIVLFL